MTHANNARKAGAVAYNGTMKKYFIAISPQAPYTVTAKARQDRFSYFAAAMAPVADRPAVPTDA